MKKNNKGFSIIFIIMLLFFVAILGFVVLNKKMIYTNYVSIIDNNITNTELLENKYFQNLSNFNTDSTNTQKQVSYNIPTDNEFHNIFYVNDDILEFLTNENYKLDSEVLTINNGNNYYLSLENTNNIELKIVSLVSGTGSNGELIQDSTPILIDTSNGGYLDDTLEFITGTGNYLQFDLTSPVAIFARNTDTSLQNTVDDINLKISFLENETGSGVFINPITSIGENIKTKIYDIFEIKDNYFLKTLDL